MPEAAPDADMMKSESLSTAAAAAIAARAAAAARLREEEQKRRLLEEEAVGACHLSPDDPEPKDNIDTQFIEQSELLRPMSNNVCDNSLLYSSLWTRSLPPESLRPSVQTLAATLVCQTVSPD